MCHVIYSQLFSLLVLWTAYLTGCSRNDDYLMFPSPYNMLWPTSLWPYVCAHSLENIYVHDAAGFGVQESWGGRGRAGRARCRTRSRREGDGDRSVDENARNRLGTGGVGRFSRAKSLAATRSLSPILSLPDHLFF